LHKSQSVGSEAVRETLYADAVEAFESSKQLKLYHMACPRHAFLGFFAFQFFRELKSLWSLATQTTAGRAQFRDPALPEKKGDSDVDTSSAFLIKPSVPAPTSIPFLSPCCGMPFHIFRSKPFF
jgi:hypothetical protein